MGMGIGGGDGSRDGGEGKEIAIKGFRCLMKSFYTCLWFPLLVYHVGLRKHCGYSVNGILADEYCGPVGRGSRGTMVAPDWTAGQQVNDRSCTWVMIDTKFQVSSH